MISWYIVSAMIVRNRLPHSSDLGICTSKLAMAHGLVVALCATVILAACDRGARDSAGEARHYEARGIVRGFSPDHRTINVEHEDIRGFMPSMTMPFSVRDPRDIARLNIGDAISFRLTVTDQDSWIDQMKRIAGEEVRLPTPTAAPEIRLAITSSPRLREGDAMPFFTLMNENGERVTLERFRGDPFVLTFIFTRCPIPNFCPRMSQNFAELQSAIKTGRGAVAKTHLLSVTLDPSFDTPAILNSYAEHLQADPKIWTFVTGDAAVIDSLTQAFSVYRQPEGGTISHGLATALIDKDGKIDKIWRGNGCRPAEILAEIRRGE